MEIIGFLSPDINPPDDQSHCNFYIYDRPSLAKLYKTTVRPFGDDHAPYIRVRLKKTQHKPELGKSYYLTVKVTKYRIIKDGTTYEGSYLRLISFRII